MDESDNSTDFFNQFLDDYFAESEEHLVNIRSCLLKIEEFVDQPSIDPGQLDELFRSFHTIKGISGMVGLSEAEELAHQMESYLKVLRDGHTLLVKKGFEALLNGTRTLERVIEAFRNHEPVPDISQASSALQLFATAESTPSSLKSDNSAVDSTSTSGKREWRFVFVPKVDFAEAGINVNSIRSRLLEIGEIVQSTPLVESNEVAFEFIVATDRHETEFSEWTSMGLTYTPVESTSGVSKASPPDDEQLSTVSTQPAQASSVRVDLARLDNLMLMVSELVVSRARLETNLKQLRSHLPAGDWRKLQEVAAVFGKQLRDLRNGVMRVRMVPIAEIFERMRFVVRDLARETNKRIILELSGQETEIDKFLVERLMDPLLHLVRNSISHGIESEADRKNAGKPAEGHVFLKAHASGDTIVLEVGDDGRGIDVAHIAERSPELELVDADGQVNNEALLDVICTPGFSTKREVDRASGRGIGMDVVRTVIQDLDGNISLETTSGAGTIFRITLPLTLAITDALIARVGDQTFAIHQSSVQEVIEIEPVSIKLMENNEIILHRGFVLPLVRLSNIFGLQQRPEGSIYAFVIGTGSRVVGLVVDKVIGLREVVVKSLTDPLVDVKGIAGATELGDGRPILILNAIELLEESKVHAANGG